MPYLIDTDWLIDRIAEVPDAMHLFERLVDDGIAISIVSYMEAYEGVLRSPHREVAEQQLTVTLASIPQLPLSRAVARRCAAVREALRTQGRRVNQRALDLIIAATAIEHGLTLVTRNVSDYADIPELVLLQ